MKRSCNRICDNIHFKHNEEDEEGFGILDHDLIFWVSEYILYIIQIGDLNYRITSDIPTLKVFDYVADDYEFLLKKDQVFLFIRCFITS